MEKETEEVLEEIKRDHRIGSLNGKWSILFRASITVFAFGFPFIVGFNIWVVQSLNEVSTNQKLITQQLEYLTKSADTYTRAEVDLAMTKLEQRVFDKISEKYPPQWLQQLVQSHSIRIEALEMKRE
jgi:hypothetical protein